MRLSPFASLSSVVVPSRYWPVRLPGAMVAAGLKKVQSISLFFSESRTARIASASPRYAAGRVSASGLPLGRLRLPAPPTTTRRLPEAFAAAIAASPTALASTIGSPPPRGLVALTMASALEASAVNALASVASSFTARTFGFLAILSGLRAAPMTQCPRDTASSKTREPTMPLAPTSRMFMGALEAVEPLRAGASKLQAAMALPANRTEAKSSPRTQYRLSMGQPCSQRQGAPRFWPIDSSMARQAELPRRSVDFDVAVLALDARG